MIRSLRMTALTVMASVSTAGGQGTSSAQPTTIEWSAYGRTPAGDRFSPATQINRDNVKSLVQAWTYRTGEIDAKTSEPVKLEATPLMVDGLLYLSTPLGKVVALDPLTGRERWKFQASVDSMGDWGDFANRGVSSWVDPSTQRGAPCHRRIFANTIDGRIFALDSRTGQKCGPQTR